MVYEQLSPTLEGCVYTHFLRVERFFVLAGNMILGGGHTSMIYDVTDSLGLVFNFYKHDVET